MRRHEHAGHVAVLLALTSLVCVKAGADYEGVAHGVSEYDTQCGGSDIGVATSMADEFSDALTDMGYDQSVLWQNQEVDGRDFTDGAFSWGVDDVDPYGTDFADTIYFVGHGSRQCSPNYFTQIFVGDDNGETSDTCIPLLTDFATWGIWPNVRLGAGGAGEDGNVLILHSSMVLQWCVVNKGKFFDLDQNGTGAQLALVNGFHGSPQQYGSLPTKTYDYADGAEFNGIGDDWVDTMTVYRGGSNDDDCAVSLVFASSESNANNMYNNGGFKDLKSTGTTHSTSMYYYLCDCDPPEGETTAGWEGC